MARSTYSDLWAFANTAGLVVSEASWPANWTLFSTGDGSTNFRLPDLTQEFVRGLASGRSLGSWQQDAMQPITGTFGLDDAQAGTPTGAFANDGAAGIGMQQSGPGIQVSFDSARQVRTASETRPRNVALMRCIYY